MSTKTRKSLTLSRPGGGKLTIHPSEWLLLQASAIEVMELAPIPEKLATLQSAVKFDDSTEEGQDEIVAAAEAFGLDPGISAEAMAQALRDYLAQIMTLPEYQEPDLEALPAKKATRANSPLSDARRVEVEFARFPADRPMKDHYRDNIREQ